MLMAADETTFGAKLRAARDKAGLTQQQLADRVGINRVVLARWETDAREPSIGSVLALAEALGITLDELAGKAGGA